MEVVLVASQLGHLSLDLLVGSKSSQSGDELTGDGGTNFQVVANDGIVSGRSREGNLGSGLESLDGDDLLTLVGKTSDAQESVNLVTSVGRPDGNVVTSSVREGGAADVNLEVNAVPVLDLEEFVGFGNGGNVRVVSVEGTLLGAFKVHLIGLAEVDFGGLRSQALTDSNAKDGFVDGLALFQAHVSSQSSPHGFLPSQKVLFHSSSAIVTLAGVANAVSAILGQEPVDIPHHGVVVFVGVVTETESDVVEVVERSVLAALGEGDVVSVDELVELDSVISGLALAVGGHDEEGDLIRGQRIHSVEVVLF